MTCPRCSLGQITDATNECQLCGYSPAGAVAVEQGSGSWVPDGVLRSLGGRFAFGSIVGRGRSSVVYQAQELASGRPVAVKVIPLATPLTTTAAQRFESLASRAVTFRHSHLAAIYEYGVNPEFVWYSMDFVPGRTLADMLRRSGPLDLHRCLRIVEQVASALDYLHRRNAAHGNLKPSNILLDSEGNWARLGDFCLSGAVGASPPGRGSGALTLASEYAAPEHFRTRAVGPAADQYAFSVVVFESLTGNLPFVGDSPEEIGRMHQSDNPPRLTEFRKDLPVHISDAVQRAMGKSPTERFPNIMDFAAILTGGWTVMSADALDPSRRPTGARHVIMFQPESHRSWGGIIGGAAAVILVAVAAYVFWPQPKPPRTAVWVDMPKSTERVPPPFNPIPPAVRPPFASAPRDSAATTEAPGGTPRAVAPGTPARPEPRPPVTRAGSGPVPTAANPAPPATPGRLFVNSTPWGQVYVDGVLIGNTPRANQPVAAGNHQLRIVRDGFEPFERGITINPGESVRMTDITLTARQP